MHKKGSFGVLSNEMLRQRFDSMLLQFLEEVEYIVITAVIDKKTMTEQAHWQEKHPYHYLMGILVEKYAQFLVRKNDVGDIMPEKRRGIKDIALQRAFEEVRRYGTNFVAADLIQKKIPSKNLKFRSKTDNITGLQICDLVAHPSYVYVRTLQRHPIAPGLYGTHIISILKTRKYDRASSGRIDGYGIKYLP